jgi:nucleoside-diphosphate-sugar epimerase
MARIAVTGSTGFIGRHVMAALAARGDDVVAVRRPFGASLASTLAGMDAVVHLAGIVSAVKERDFFSANVGATRIVADASRAAGARLVHISSLAAAGPSPPSAPHREGDPMRPITAYGRSKLEGEQAVAQTEGLRWIVLRPGVVYGPGDRALRPLFQLASAGIVPLVGNLDASYTFIHVDDMVRTILAAVDSRLEGDAFYVGHPKPVSTREVAHSVRAAAGRPVALLRVPMPLLRLAAAAGDAGQWLTGRPWPLNGRRYAEMSAAGFVCSVDRLRDRLGVVARIDWKEGIARSTPWYTQRPSS